MPLQTSMQQAAVAREVALEVAAEYTRLVTARGTEAARRAFGEEAARGLAALDVPLQEAQADIGAEIEASEDPDAMLRLLVAELRAVQRLGLEREIAGEMARLDGAGAVG